MPLIPLFLIFITLSNEVNASELDVKPFRIVNKKQHMSLCMQKAVTLHSGNVIKQSIIDKDQHFLVEYEIKTRNGAWLVTCDLENGNITKEQQSN
ncbi:MAG: hypothetical protein K9K84_10610 [Methylovulum sp.]|nr:hypothetical protein [Methylovulum sp.]